MYDGARDSDQSDNLLQPLPGDHGARGAFDARARDHSPQLWLSTHPWVYRGVAVALGLIAAIRTGHRPGTKSG